MSVDPKQVARMGIATTVIALAVAFVGPAASACPVPVFQYALEQWEADPYVVVVHHEGELDEPQRALVRWLRETADGEQGKANLTVGFRDYALAAAAPTPARELPYVELRYPSVSEIRGAVLTAPLTREALERMLDSPLRRQLAERLLERKAAVWLMLDSGDRRADGRVAELLKAQLPRLERTLTVPDPAQWGLELAGIHQEIAFSMLRLSRDDQAAEAALLKMLLGTEPDLHAYADQPMVFVIYGRALVMYALIGEGINARTVRLAGEFVTGPCSCQVKAGNPGVDLLMRVDWAAKVEQRFDPAAVAPPVGPQRFLERLHRTEQEEQP